MTGAPDTAATAAVDAVLSRYFNLEVALVGGWGPELTVTRARLVAELTDIVAEGREAERQRIADVISPEQFRKLADWFDADDEFKEAMFPETWSPGSRKDEVQQDLRAVADLLDGAS